MILIGRNPARVADLAADISEDVLYMVKGTTARHPAPEPPVAGSVG